MALLCPGYCGHYAVFFAVRMLELRHCWAPDGLSRCIRSVADPVSFWKRSVSNCWENTNLIMTPSELITDTGSQYLSC